MTPGARGPRGGPPEVRDGKDYPVPCCEAGCEYRARTPQSLVSHHSARHGGAPFNAQERGKEEWQQKLRRSTDAVVKATGVRPGVPGWHSGNHVGRGRGGGGGRSRGRSGW